MTAKVSFEHFEWKNDLEEDYFEVPSNFKEDNERFEMAESKKNFNLKVYSSVNS